MLKCSSIVDAYSQIINSFYLVHATLMYYKGQREDSDNHIFVSSYDPAQETLFFLSKPTHAIIKDTLVCRGSKQDNLPELDRIDSNMIDLAVLRFDKSTKYVNENAFLLLPPHAVLLMPSDHRSLNAKLYLIGHNGELGAASDLNPYKYLKGFRSMYMTRMLL